MQNQTTPTATREDLQLRQIGRGFIVGQEPRLMGQRLTNAYLDQHDKMYVMVNNAFEPLGNCQRFLVVA